MITAVLMIVLIVLQAYGGGQRTPGQSVLGSSEGASAHAGGQLDSARQ